MIDARSVEDFVALYENAAKHGGLDPASYLVNYLDQELLNYYNTFLRDKTWEEMKTILTKEYTKIQPLRTWGHDLNNIEVLDGKKNSLIAFKVKVGGLHKRLQLIEGGPTPDSVFNLLLYDHLDPKLREKLLKKCGGEYITDKFENFLSQLDIVHNEYQTEMASQAGRAVSVNDVSRKSSFKKKTSFKKELSDGQVSKFKKKLDRTKITCFNCNGRGHFQNECLKQRKVDLIYRLTNESSSNSRQVNAEINW